MWARCFSPMPTLYASSVAWLFPSCYLMARGYENTRSWPRYLGRLLVLGVIAQSLYAWLFPCGLNILFTPALGLLDRCNRTGALLLCLSALFVPCLDYSMAGPFAVLAFHLLRPGDKQHGYVFFTASMPLLTSAAPLQLFAFAALYFLHPAESSTWDLPLIYPRLHVPLLRLLPAAPSRARCNQRCRSLILLSSPGCLPLGSSSAPLLSTLLTVQHAPPFRVPDHAAAARCECTYQRRTSTLRGSPGSARTSYSA